MFSLGCFVSPKVKYDEVMNPKNPTTYLFTDKLCRLAIQLLLQVRSSPWEHAAIEVHWNHQNNKDGTEQALTRNIMFWCSTSERTGSNSSSVSAWHSHHISDFLTCLSGTVRTKFGFLWKGSIEVHLEVHSKETGKNHGMGNVGRDHWRLSSPTSQLKQGLPEHITQECVQNENGSLRVPKNHGSFP